MRHGSYTLLLCSFIASIFVVSLDSLGGSEANYLWDDALFFKRVGMNIVQHGSAVWNTTDGPVYGNTSQLMQLLSAFITLFSDNYYHAFIKLISSVFLIACYYFLRPSISNIARHYLILTALVSPILLLSTTSGMETIFALSILSIFYYYLYERSRDKLRIWQVAMINLIVYLVRPDMVIISLAETVHSSHQQAKIDYQYLVSTTLSSLGLIFFSILFMDWYYGTPLPLGFYLKSHFMSMYNMDYIMLGMKAKLKNILTLGILFGPFVLLIIFSRIKKLWVHLLIALLYISYHLISTNEIMGYHARFYLPATISIIFAASRIEFDTLQKKYFISFFIVNIICALALFERNMIEKTGRNFYLSWIESSDYITYFCLLSIFALSLFIKRNQLLYVAGSMLFFISTSYYYWPDKYEILSDNEAMIKMANKYQSTVGIKKIQSCFQEPFTLYHTEIGLPGAMFQDSIIRDFSGLMNKEYARSNKNFEEFCRLDKPEFIYLPHWTRRSLREDVLHGECIQNYQEVEVDRHTSCPLYVRSDLVTHFNECTMAGASNFHR